MEITMEVYEALRHILFSKELGKKTGIAVCFFLELIVKRI